MDLEDAQLVSPARRVKPLTTATFESTLASSDRLAVLKFYAPWCAACKRIAPEYNRVAAEYEGQADFYDVDFRRAKQVFRSQRVVVFPTILLVLPNIGCFERFSLLYQNRKQLGQRVAAALDEDRAQAFRTLDPSALGPIVRFKELLGVVHALRSAPDYLAKDAAMWASEQQRREMKSLFAWLDRNGDGVIDQEEMAAACGALQAASPSAACAFSAEQLLELMTAADGDATTTTVDQAAFLRLMAHQAMDEGREGALLDTFRALDVDGNGSLEVDEIVNVLTGLTEALGDGRDEVLGTVEPQKLKVLLRAFDLDGEGGSVDYEEFFNMVAGRDVSRS